MARPDRGGPGGHHGRRGSVLADPLSRPDARAGRRRGGPADRVQGTPPPARNHRLVRPRASGPGGDGPHVGLRGRRADHLPHALDAADRRQLGSAGRGRDPPRAARPWTDPGHGGEAGTGRRSGVLRSTDPGSPPLDVAPRRDAGGSPEPRDPLVPLRHPAHVGAGVRREPGRPPLCRLSLPPDRLGGARPPAAPLDRARRRPSPRQPLPLGPPGRGDCPGCGVAGAQGAAPGGDDGAAGALRCVRGDGVGPDGSTGPGGGSGALGAGG